MGAQHCSPSLAYFGAVEVMSNMNLNRLDGLHLTRTSSFRSSILGMLVRQSMGSSSVA
jgi:hypothetical protein